MKTEERYAILDNYGIIFEGQTLEEMCNIIREELYRSYPEVFERKDFLPKQKLEQFKF